MTRRVSKPDSSARAIQLLIFEVERLDLTKAKQLAVERLSGLGLQAELLNFALYQISVQQSKADLLSTLVSLANFLSTQSSGQTQDRLSRIAVRKVGASDKRYTFISVDEILYAFVGSAVSRHLIQADWIRAVLFRQDRVYVRTSKGIFATHFRSLRELQQRLDPQLLSAVHQSIFINLRHISAIDIGGRIKQVGVTVANGIVEWQTVSRRLLRNLRLRLGLPSRGMK